ncbi:hypothetical protein F4778DRAFT_278725 [Xylariomycetidae sp. FL2044]|nr:hypothetical protein F4778DRAFT_278725 [Xylariomycetidae sp. FL2044]
MRLAACLFLGKIFAPGFSYRLGIWIVTGLSAAYGIAVVVVPLAVCRPISAHWDTLPEQCGDEIAAYVGLEVPGLVLDVAIIVAPLRGIWRLQMSRTRRLGVTVLLSLGSMYVLVFFFFFCFFSLLSQYSPTLDDGGIGGLSRFCFS